MAGTISFFGNLASEFRTVCLGEFADLFSQRTKLKHQYIGKESNSLEEVDTGLIHTAENVYTEYRDRRRDEWQTKILPALKKIPTPILVKMSGLSPSTIKDTLAERSRPHQNNQKRLVAILRQLKG